MRWWFALVAAVVVAPAATACDVSFPVVELRVPAMDAVQAECWSEGQGCPSLPAEPTPMPGILRVRYTMDAPCFVEGPVPAADLEVRFERTTMTPDWLQFSVDPQRLTIPASTFWHPDRMDTDGSDVWWETEVPVTVVIGQAWWPTAEEREHVNTTRGFIMAAVKVHVTSDETVATGWRDAFGVGAWYFDAAPYGPLEVHDEPLREQAPLGVGFLVAPLAAGLLRRR